MKRNLRYIEAFVVTCVVALVMGLFGLGLNVMYLIDGASRAFFVLFFIFEIVPTLVILVIWREALLSAPPRRQLLDETDVNA